jgi:hypothetical protein
LPELLFRLNENAHNQFTNQQLAELREHAEVKLENSIVGMQMQMRQRFAAVDARLDQQDGKLQQIGDLLARQGPQVYNSQEEAPGAYVVPGASS